MRRFAAVLMACLLLCCTLALAQDDDSWIVVEEDYTPDVMYQAGVLMRRMSLNDKVWQMLFICPEDLTGEEYTVEWPRDGVLEKCPAGGILLFGQNIVSAEQLDKLTADIVRDAENEPYPPFIAVEEEGGTVSRVANKLGLPFLPTPAQIGKTGSADDAYSAGKAIGEYLRPFRFSLDFAPDADVLTVPQSELGTRSFGSDPAVVSQMALAFTQGLKDSGLAACYKHFPGQGTTSGKIYRGTAHSRRTLEEMTECELIPFADAISAGVPMIMVSHMEARGIDDSGPASLSYTVVTRLLRESMGFEGVIVTDSLRGRPIRGTKSAAELALACIRAGADMLLLPYDARTAAQGIVNAVRSGELTENRIDESVRRILAMKINMGLIQ